MYQLRGRVGRTKPYCLCVPHAYQPDKSNRSQREALKAMRDFTELGSGFKIAMRDLSIRGAEFALKTTARIYRFGRDSIYSQY